MRGEGTYGDGAVTIGTQETAPAPLAVLDTDEYWEGTFPKSLSAVLQAGTGRLRQALAEVAGTGVTPAEATAPPTSAER